jgi:FMN phosphatase YigB (HAD superfamily)
MPISKDLFDYKAVVFDMDGTLYYQFPLKIFMIFEISAFCFLHPLKIKDLFVIQSFRKLRESKILLQNKNFVAQQYSITAEKFSMPVERVYEIINLWIYEKPLKYLRFCKDRKLAKLIESLHKNKATIVIYSDYPAVNKVKKLNIKPDYIFDSEDKNIISLKPNTEGIRRIKNILNINFSDMLIVGDRYEKDGICAQTESIDYIILPTNPIKRNKIYKSLKKRKKC